MEARRAIDLCTCGKPRTDIVHGSVRSGVAMMPPAGHSFIPQPQPATVGARRFVPTPGLPVDLLRVSAICQAGTWVATVHGATKIGFGQASTWLAALNAAIEDLTEKE